MERLILKLKLQYFGHLMRTDSLEKTLMLGKIEDKEEKRTIEDEIVGWHHQLDGYELEQAPGVCSRTRRPDMLQCMGSKTVKHD